MYLELVKAMKKNKVTMKELAKMIGCGQNSITRKVNGTTAFTADEIDIVLERFNSKYEILFRKEPQGQQKSRYAVAGNNGFCTE
jgi:plasmid maintenance system antidote protein VapI